MNNWLQIVNGYDPKYSNTLEDQNSVTILLIRQVEKISAQFKILNLPFNSYDFSVNLIFHNWLFIISGENKKLRYIIVNPKTTNNGFNYLYSLNKINEVEDENKKIYKVINEDYDYDDYEFYVKKSCGFLIKWTNTSTNFIYMLGRYCQNWLNALRILENNQSFLFQTFILPTTQPCNIETDSAYISQMYHFLTQQQVKRDKKNKLFSNNTPLARIQVEPSEYRQIIGSGIPSLFYESPKTDQTLRPQELLEYWAELIDRMCGIDHKNPAEKKERLVSEEANKATKSNVLTIKSLVNCIEQCFNIVNKYLKTNIIIRLDEEDEVNDPQL